MTYDVAKARLKHAATTGRMPHALLLTDASGAECGLWAFAAKLLLCESPAKDAPCACIACRRFEAGNQADFILVEDEKGIKIDRIRLLETELAPRPLSGRRAVVIRRADIMTREAQNALLKSIEEPLGHTSFIITAKGAMLPTLRSRLMELRCAGEAEPAAFEGDIAECARRGLRMGRGELVPLEKGEKLDQLLDIWEAIFRGALLVKHGSSETPHPALLKIIADTAKNFTTARLLGIMETIYQAKRRLQSNANPLLTLDFMAARLGSGDKIRP